MLTRKIKSRNNERHKEENAQNALPQVYDNIGYIQNKAGAQPRDTSPDVRAVG